MDGNNVAYTYHPGGRIESITDGTGHRKLGYDALGNMVHENRYIAIPNSANVIAFHTEYTYDSWGRMRTLRYPDGEQVTYIYRWGGDLFSVHGTKGADSCRYVDSIAYNAYGQRSYIHYGNGTMASYTYDALHRLIYLESRDSLGDPMQQIKYAFDPSSNITHIANNAPNIGPLGGRYQNYYKYDPLHRLTRAGGSNQYRFEQAFELSRAGRPLSMLTNGMVKHYAYGEHTPPHAPQRIMVEDGYRRTLHDLRWDPAGNLGQVSTLAHDRGDIQSRFLFWTEDSRLHTVVDDRHHSYYAYDHAGGSCGSRAQSQACLSYAEMQQRRQSQRTLKVTGRCDRLDINAWILHTVTSLRDHTVYPSPYIVLSNHGYTKHYYAGSERLAARIGGGFGRAILHEQTDLTMTATHLFKQSQHHSNERHLNAPPAHTIRREGHLERVFRGMEIEFAIPEAVRAEVHLDPEGLIQAAQNIVSDNTEPDVYFYHSDHLGSASWITDGDGIPVQHLQYLPYGEPFVNQRAAGSTYRERFTFTGKERDEETGYSYFGARYMDHELMTMWLSVDPLADKYPSISPYAYCAWNPVKLVDPDGMEAFDNTDGWKVDKHNKTIVNINPIGGDFVQHVTGDDCYQFYGSQAELLERYDGFTITDGSGITSTISSGNTTSEPSPGGGHYDPVNTTLDYVEGFRQGWNHTSNKNRYAILNRMHVKGQLEAKPGATKNALNKATSSGSKVMRSFGRANFVYSLYDIGESISMDNGRPGINTAGSIGSAAGGWAGAKVGAWLGATAGAFGGPCGALVGGIVGAVGGGFGGNLLGDKAGRTIYNNF